MSPELEAAVARLEAADRFVAWKGQWSYHCGDDLRLVLAAVREAEREPVAPMNLPDAIAQMLKGVVMVDNNGILHRAAIVWGQCGIERFSFGCRGWIMSDHYKDIDGWRPATPEELKEIEKQ